MPNKPAPAATTFARLASMSINSFDPATGTFSAIAATETPVSRSDYFDGNYAEVLSLKPSAVRLGRLQSGRAPLLDSHRAGSTKDQIGVITGARLEGGQLVIDGQLSKRDDVKPIATDIAAGVLRNVSVGYLVYESVETKGQDGARTLTRTDWEPMEVSIVPVGADSQAHIRSTKGTSMPRTTRTSQPPATITDDSDIDVTDENVERNGSDNLTRGVDQRHVREVRRACISGGLTDDFANDLVARGLTIEQCRAAIFNQLASRSASVRIDSVHSADQSFSNPDFLGDSIQAALYARMTGRPAEGAAAEWRGRSLLDMGAAILEARGERPNWRRRDKLASQVMTRGGQHTISDFPNLLSSAGTRVLSDAYKAAESPLKNLARRKDATDFRALSSLKLSEAPRLLEVLESGEVKQGSRSEAKESFRLKTFARIFSLSRNAIINDDLQAFSDTNVAWGRAAAETEADQLVALLTANGGDGVAMDDTNPLYTTTRGNKAASGGAIAIATLSTARQAMRTTTGLDGETIISATPKHLVVGAAKETEAEQLLATLAAALVTSVNPFANKLTLQVEPRLAGNAWRLFADPSDLGVLAIAYLNGHEGPVMEVQQGWEVLGTEFRCILDFGCGVTDWRGTYLNPGN
jgi:hypothetical protein